MLAALVALCLQLTSGIPSVLSRQVTRLTSWQRQLHSDRYVPSERVDPLHQTAECGRGASRSSFGARVAGLHAAARPQAWWHRHV